MGSGNLHLPRYHCGYIAMTDAEARAHFGNADDEVARCVRLRAEGKHHGGQEIHDMVTLGFHVCISPRSACPGLQQTLPDTHGAEIALVAANFPGEPPLALIAAAPSASDASQLGGLLDLIEVWKTTVAFALATAPDRLVWVARDRHGHFYRVAPDRARPAQSIAHPLFVRGHRARSEEAFRAAFGDTGAYLLARLGGLAELQRAYAAQPR